MSWTKKIAVGVGGLLGLGALLISGYVVDAVATAESRMSFPDTPYPDLASTTDPEVIARGAYLFYGPAHCIQCHGDSDRAHPEKNLVPGAPPKGGLEFAMGPIATTWAANLTPDPETGIGSWSDAEVARAIRHGVMKDGTLSLFMATSVSRLSDEDTVAILSFLRAQPPVKNAVQPGAWGLLGKLLLPLMPLKPRMDAPPAHVAAAEEPTVARGEYLAGHVALCAECHREFDMATFQPVGPPAGGSLPEPSHGEDHDMEFVAPNLTSHPTGYTGKVDEEAFVARLRQGRAHASSIMPWESISTMTEADMRSVYRYLRSLPPVDNDVGPTRRPIGWTPEPT